MYDRMERSRSARCHLVEQMWIQRKTDSPTLTPDNTKEKSLVLLLISMHVSFIWRKGELESKKSVPGAVQLCTIPYTGPVTVLSVFCMKATKLVWLLPIIQWWSMMINLERKKYMVRFYFPSQQSNRMIQVSSSRKLTEGDGTPCVGIRVRSVKWGLCLPSWPGQHVV